MRGYMIAGAAALLLAGCEGSRLEEARGRLEKAQAELRTGRERSKALAVEVEQLRERQRKAEASAAQSRRELEQLQMKLANSWQGDVARLGEQMNEAKVPESLRSWLVATQQAKGSTVAERRFLQGLERKDTGEVQSALNDWELRTGVTAVPREEQPEAPSCELPESTFSCAPLPVGGPEDKVTQLCSDPQGELLWVLRSLQGRLEALRLMPPSRASFSVARVFSPGWWVLELEEPEARRLVAFEVSSSTATARQAISLTGGEGVQVDLDGDGEVELVGLGREVVGALHYSRKADRVEEWEMTAVCPLLEKRTERELEPAKAACAARARARAPADAGTP